MLECLWSRKSFVSCIRCFFSESFQWPKTLGLVWWRCSQHRGDGIIYLQNVQSLLIVLGDLVNWNEANVVIISRVSNDVILGDRNGVRSLCPPQNCHWPYRPPWGLSLSRIAQHVTTELCGQTDVCLSTKTNKFQAPSLLVLPLVWSLLARGRQTSWWGATENAYS